MLETEFNAKIGEILQSIPKEFHSALSYYAWEQGHSAGFEEVISVLRNLVSDLQSSFETYEKNHKGLV